MTLELDNLQFIISSLTLIGFVIMAYRTFRDPDIQSERSIALLEEQVKFERKMTDTSLQIQQNALHSLEREIYNQGEAIKELNNEIIKLRTIIEERVPQQK